MNTESINRRDYKRRLFNPCKFVLEFNTQATLDVRENGHGTHSTRAMHYSPFVPNGINNDLDAPLLSLDRRFIVRVSTDDQISKLLQNLSAIALSCLSSRKQSAELLKDCTTKTEG